jgi:hypothetical protein
MGTIVAQLVINLGIAVAGYLYFQNPWYFLFIFQQVEWPLRPSCVNCPTGKYRSTAVTQMSAFGKRRMAAVGPTLPDAQPSPTAATAAKRPVGCKTRTAVEGRLKPVVIFAATPKEALVQVRSTGQRALPWLPAPRIHPKNRS